MVNDFFNGTVNANFHLRFFKRLLLLCNATGLVIYALLHFVLFDFPFETAEEMRVLARLFGVCSLFALALSMLIFAADALEYWLRNRNRMQWQQPFRLAAAVALVAAVALASCNGKSIRVGVKKDFNTGMSSSYSGMEPGKSFLVMNNEILNHTDIPLGENFLLVNDGIEGLEVRNGKVKVGCSLSLSDEHGNVLLQEKDLFEGRDEFAEKDASMLKCTVNTGKPMQPDQAYNVAVTFWDKNSSGKIENKVTIRSIDLP